MIKRTINKEDMKVLVAQPTNYPNELISMLSSYFNTKKNVTRAYLACVQYPNVKEPLKLVIGIESSNDLKKIVDELKNSLNLLSKKVDKIDFVHALDSPYKGYFSKIEPFYGIGGQVFTWHI